MIRILIAGDGVNEIRPFTKGSPLATKSVSDGRGVIDALLAKVRPGGWEVRQRLLWKDVRKYSPNAPGQGEERTVNALLLLARERGCNALIFLRDRDGSRRRERAIANAVRRAPKLVTRPPAIAAGVPIEMLEAWLLALRGEEHTESCENPVATLTEKFSVPPKKTTAMVQLVQNSSLCNVAADAKSLRRWLRRVAQALNVTVKRDWP